jgi:hypothetical protein
LGHLTSVFEEELTRTGDEQLALAQTEIRFGNPSDVAVNLQESVPRFDVAKRFFEELGQPRAGESVLRRAIRLGILAAATTEFLHILLCLLIFPWIGKTKEIPIACYILTLVTIAEGMIVFLTTILMSAISRALFTGSPRSYSRAVIAAAVSLLVPSLAPLIIVLGMTPFVADGLNVNPILMGGVPATFLFPLTLIGVTKLLADEQRYRDEWAQLQID